MELIEHLALSLGATLALELMFALLWGVKKEDLSLVALVNVLTNPVVVLLHWLCALWAPALLAAATACLEAGAMAAEGWILYRRSDIARPWLFALCVNLFSYLTGAMLLR